MRAYDVLGLGRDVPAHVGRVVVGIRHPVQVDQASRVALSAERDKAWRSRRPATSRIIGGIRHPVPPHDRHRADDSRSRGHAGAGHGQRHRAKTHRRREHGLHVRQGECERAIEARHAVLSRCSPIARSTTTAGMPARRRPPRPGPWERPSCPMVNAYEWELYNLTDDYSQYNDLASKQSRRSSNNCRRLFLAEAAKYEVLPLG